MHLFLFVIPEGNLRFVQRSRMRKDGHGAKTRVSVLGIYALESVSYSLYGFTNNLHRRIEQHRRQTGDSFTARYKIIRLVHVEQFQYVNSAIAREKELKHWTRAQKIALIEAMNPTWEELMPDSELN